MQVFKSSQEPEPGEGKGDLVLDFERVAPARAEDDCHGFLAVSPEYFAEVSRHGESAALDELPRSEDRDHDRAKD